MQIETAHISRNIEHIKSRIQAAASRAGRSLDDIQLIAVTKLQPVEYIRAALECGQYDFGENYPEETQRKIEEMPNLGKPIHWHMIGHMQSRKARIVARYFSCIHSIDSIHAAEVLSRELAGVNKTINGLIELNLSGENSKTGFPAWDKAVQNQTLLDIEQIGSFNQIKIIGLMTMPRLSDNPEDSRSIYQELKRIQGLFSVRFPTQNWHALSMGTSFDYEIAIEEGSTMVRIGEAIFGPR